MRSSPYRAIYWTGLSSDVFLELRRGEDLTLAVGDGRVRRGESSGIVIWGAGDGEYIPLQRKQDGSPTYDLTQYQAATSHNLLRVEICAHQSLPSHLFGLRTVVRCIFGST